VFRRAEPQFITVNSGSQGTAVYVAGALAGTAPHIRIPKAAFIGRILLGDSPLQPSGWNGKIRGLAIYDAEPTAPQVFQHYYTWTKNGHPEVHDAERLIALYLFDEHSGNVVHNHVKLRVDSVHPPKTYGCGQALHGAVLAGIQPVSRLLVKCTKEHRGLRPSVLLPVSLPGSASRQVDDTPYHRSGSHR
jgi:hypothetical protein